MKIVNDEGKDFLQQFKEAVDTAKILAPKNLAIASMIPMLETELEMIEFATVKQQEKE